MSKEREAAKLKKLYKSVENNKSLSYVKIGKLLNVDKSQVSHMLNGRNPINLERGLQLAKIIGCQLADFSPRLQAEADSLTSQVGKDTLGGVYLLANYEMKEIVKILTAKGGAKQTIFWPHEHSVETYAVPVEGESNSPSLPHGSLAVVDTNQLDLEVGSTYCFIRKKVVRYAKYQGDQMFGYMNYDYPDRIFSLKKAELVGRVIGKQETL